MAIGQGHCAKVDWHELSQHRIGLSAGHAASGVVEVAGPEVSVLLVNTEMV